MASAQVLLWPTPFCRKDTTDLSRTRFRIHSRRPAEYSAGLLVSAACSDLKGQFESQLSDARIESSARVAEIGASREARAGRVRRSDVEHLAVEAGDVHPVEEVEELGDELQPAPLGEVEGLRRAEVEADEVARVKRVASEAWRAVRVAVTVVVEVKIGGEPCRVRQIAARLEDAAQLPAADD